MARHKYLTLFVLFVLSCSSVTASPEDTFQAVGENTNGTQTPNNKAAALTSMKINAKLEKWEQYHDLDEVFMTKHIETYAPSNLPQGFGLQIVEYYVRILEN